MTPPRTLIGESQFFAQQLTETVRNSVEPECMDFQAVAVDDRVVVRQSPREGIALKIAGQHLVTLTATYRLDWDRYGHFLAVHESAFKVYSGDAASGEPLFRYEFQKSNPDDLPNAHIHMHGQRDALAYVMTMASRGTPRGRQRAKGVARAQSPTMSDLHLPVGGD